MKLTRLFLILSLFLLAVSQIGCVATYDSNGIRVVHAVAPEDENSVFSYYYHEPGKVK